MLIRGRWKGLAVGRKEAASRLVKGTFQLYFESKSLSNWNLLPHIMVMIAKESILWELQRLYNIKNIVVASISQMGGGGEGDICHSCALISQPSNFYLAASLIL